MNIEVNSNDNEMQENNEFVGSTGRFQIMVKLYKREEISLKEKIYIKIITELFL
jgi:hypothetical protein